MTTRLPAFLSHEDNKATDAATAIAVSSTASGYPIGNLRLPRLSKTHRTDGAISGVIYDFDLGSAQNIEGAAFLNCNFTSAAVLTLTAGAVSAASTFTTTVPYQRLYDFAKWLSAAQNYRYWRLTVTDAANPDGYLEMGYPALGDFTVLEKAMANGWQRMHDFQNQNQMSEFGVRNVAELFEQTKFMLEFQNRTSTEIDTLLTIFKQAKMNVTPVVFWPDTTVNDAYFGTFARSFQVSRVNETRSTAGVEFAEDSRGKKLPA